jgi:hypothetical protein
MPHLAFRHLDGHAERVAQVAALASAQPPQVLPAHLGAAFEALRAADIALCERALAASRLLQIEDALHQLLACQAQSLRAAALAEAVRTPLMLAAELVADASDALPRHVKAAREQIATERSDLARCADAAEREALGVLDREIAGMRANTHAFVRRAAGEADVQRQWQRFVAEQRLDAPLAAFIDRLNRDTMAAGVLLEREDRLRRAVASTVALEEAPRRRFWRSFRSALAGAFRRIVSGLLGGRKLARRGAVAGAARKVPWLGWALLAADAVGGAARGISDEAARSRIEESRWQQDAHAAVHAEVDRLRAALAVRLTDAAATARAAIETQLADALAATDAAEEQLRSYRTLLPRLESATWAVDLVLARRLASLSGANAADIERAERAPGRTFDIWVRAGASRDHDELARTIRTCLRERATVHCEAARPALAATGR